MKKVLRPVGSWLWRLALVLAAVLTFAPFFWMLCAAFKTKGDFFTHTFLPPLDRLTLENFVKLFSKEPFLEHAANSMWVTGCTVLGQLFICTMGGFALAKYRFRGRGMVLVLMLGTMMLPGQLLLAPMYEQIYFLGLMNSYAGLVVPSLVNVFGIFLFRQAMMSVPDELIEAARMDGCGEFRIYWTVMLPLVRPMTGAFCLISFIASWNSFIWPQIILQSKDKFTLPIAINQMQGVYSDDLGMMMAGTVLSIAPVFALFLLLQREFISGLTAGAVKG
jgi:ABC-type glycerol-3-phosphate transport system permease component